MRNNIHTETSRQLKSAQYLFKSISRQKFIVHRKVTLHRKSTPYQLKFRLHRLKSKISPSTVKLKALLRLTKHRYWWWFWFFFNLLIYTVFFVFVSILLN